MRSATARARRRGSLSRRVEDAQPRSSTGLTSLRVAAREARAPTTTRSQGSLPLYKGLIDLIVKTDSRYYCFVADRNIADPVKRFARDAWLACEKLATEALIGAARRTSS